MHPRRARRGRRFCSIPPPEERRVRQMRGLSLLLLLCALLLFLSGAAMFLKDISCQIAVSDARDIVTVEINNAVASLMAEGDFQTDDFVSFEKNADGEVAAIHSNLTGVSLLMGRGPSVPVKIIMLTSSRVELGDSVVTAGINQTKHQISLNVIVDIDILIPWGTETTEVMTEVMIADTLVVGKVPGTYLNLQE